MSKYTQKPYTQEEKKKAIETYSEKIQYSARYNNEDWEYRHVIIPKQLVRFCPPGVLAEDIWRGLGIRQSPGWEMYMRHDPEPHVLLFRRPRDYDNRHPPLGTSSGVNRLVNLVKK